MVVFFCCEDQKKDDHIYLIVSLHTLWRKKKETLHAALRVEVKTEKKNLKKNRKKI
jgi:hypothetical protein